MYVDQKKSYKKYLQNLITKQKNTYYSPKLV